MTVFGFDNMDEYVAIEAAAEKAANERIKPEQADLRDDTEHTRYFVRALPDCLGFGEVPTYEDLVKTYAEYYNLDDEDDDNEREEYESLVAGLPALRARGYLTATVYTVHGDEKGRDTHVSEVIPISKEAFEQARRTDWRMVMPDGLLALVGNQDDLVAAGKITPLLVEETNVWFRAYPEGE